MPKQSHTIFSVLRRGGVLPRPREGQSPSPTHFLNASVGADDPVRPRPVAQRFVGQGPRALPVRWGKRIPQSRLRRVQPPLGKGAEGTGEADCHGRGAPSQ